MFRTFSYPLRPTKAQEVTLNTWLAQCCELYNAALQERRDAWKLQAKSIGLYEQNRGLTEWRKSDAEATAVPSRVQRDSLRRVDLAFAAFFRRCRTGEKPGYPRFKSKWRYGSFSISCGQDVAHLDGDRLTLPKLKAIKVHLYRPIRGRPVQVTVQRGPKGWSASFACDVGAAPEKVTPVSIVGIDVGLRSLAVTSDGETVVNPRRAARAAAKLARVQRVLARRKRGSKSRQRAKAAVARCYAHIRNQRLDHARKTAKHIVDKYDVIAHEDLNIRAMSRGMFAKGISEAGWGILLRCIALKAESAGKHVIAVDPRGTSQRCSRCGTTVPKDLSCRIHDCPSCGLVLDRDENAARNICALGRSAVTELGALGQVQARSGASHTTDEPME